MLHEYYFAHSLYLHGKYDGCSKSAQRRKERRLIEAMMSAYYKNSTKITGRSINLINWSTRTIYVGTVIPMTKIRQRAFFGFNFIPMRTKFVMVYLVFRSRKSSYDYELY